MELGGRIALITGGGSGIGRATSKRLHSEGMQLCVVDVNGDTASAVADEVGGLAVTANVADPEQLDGAFDQCLECYGRLDVAHLNAGVTGGGGDIADLDVDRYRRAVAVNVDHVVFGTREAVSAFRRQPTDGGPRAVVATSSLAGIDPFLPDPIYTLTKHAVVGFIRSIAPDLAAEGIAAHAICPGLHDTGQLPPDRKKVLEDAGAVVGDPAGIAEAVVRAITSPIDATGTCWVGHPGEAPLPWKFQDVPGPQNLFNLPRKR